MKLRTRLLCYTAAAVLSASAAFAAIDGQSLADAYLADGYEYVAVTVGPMQTKVEAIKGNLKVEVVYDNETLQVIKREVETADATERGRTGKTVRTSARDFEDDEDHGKTSALDDDDDEDDGDDDQGGHDGDDDDDDDGGGDDDDD